MAFQFTQTGAEIQDILDQVPVNTSDITTLANKFTSGTWTPTIPRANVSSASGKWYQIGDIIVMYGSIAFTNSQTNQGNLFIDESYLPFSSRMQIFGSGITAYGTVTLGNNKNINNNVWFGINGEGRSVATNTEISGGSMMFGLVAVPI